MMTRMEVLIGSLLLLCSVVASDGGECDACMHDGNDLAGCKDYGVMMNGAAPDQSLVAWHLGSDDCLEAYNIKVPSLDPYIVCLSGDSFVTELQMGALSGSYTFKLALGETNDYFFRQDDTGAVVLKDSITIDGNVIDCTSSSRTCYTAMKPYFGFNPNGQREMEEICDRIEREFRADRQLEQSQLRNELCTQVRSGVAPPQYCDPLCTQVEEKMNEHDDASLACWAFAQSASNTTVPIPGCDTLNAENQKIQLANDGSAAASGKVASAILALVWGIGGLFI